ncbi:hypothetical protein F511_28737 [Dorcoceras hygrometricum]|uniref:Uncharacterized protein n=1 Tax=Dorcoceras hygrometricum TaxID=472368 RepID=A0A2Z7ABH3_9LAMI|nr:hypothetical protein F511_28737 [Dorcoceras hygrometricum]
MILGKNSKLLVAGCEVAVPLFEFVRLSAEWSNAIIGVVDRRSCRIGIPPSCDGLTGLEYHGSMISPRWIFTEWV